MSRLGQSVHNYPNCIMFPLGEGKTKYEIYSNVIPLPLGNWKGIQYTGWYLVFSVYLLTRQTLRHVLKNVLFRPSPPVILFHILVHFISSRVHGENSIVAIIQYFLSQIHIIQYAQSALVQQTSIFIYGIISLVSSTD